LASLQNDVALFLFSQGRHKEAEELTLNALKYRKEILGEKHPDTLTSMNNLASTYSQQGRHKEAEELKSHVLECRKEILGEKHSSDSFWILKRLISNL